MAHQMCPGFIPGPRLGPGTKAGTHEESQVPIADCPLPIRYSPLAHALRSKNPPFPW